MDNEAGGQYNAVLVRHRSTGNDDEGWRGKGRN